MVEETLSDRVGKHAVFWNSFLFTLVKIEWVNNCVKNLYNIHLRIYIMIGIVLTYHQFHVDIVYWLNFDKCNRKKFRKIPHSATLLNDNVGIHGAIVLCFVYVFILTRGLVVSKFHHVSLISDQLETSLNETSEVFVLFVSQNIIILLTVFLFGNWDLSQCENSLLFFFAMRGTTVVDQKFLKQD